MRSRNCRNAERANKYPIRALSERFIARLRYSPSLARGAFGRLERDVAGKAFGDDDVDLARADIVALDKTDIFEIGPPPLAQNAPRLAHWFKAFHFLDPDIEKTDRRALQPEQDARGGRAHHRKIDQVLGVRTDRGADVEHDRFAAQRRP